jgi:hypothetical protein
MLAHRWGRRSARPTDFLLGNRRRFMTQSPAAMEQTLRTFAAVHNARLAGSRAA